MKKVLLAWLLGWIFVSCQHHSQWQLTWEENFDGVELDSTVWSIISSEMVEGQGVMSCNDRCYELHDGVLTLRGMINENVRCDSFPFLTGGVWTKGKKFFSKGRIEVRAKLEGAQGAWPAVWMLPNDTEGNPYHDVGEVDIMERLNHDPFVYQEVHSFHVRGRVDGKASSNGVTVPVRPDVFNVYGVDFWPDSLVFHVNGVKTFTYARTDADKHGVFPFDMPQCLLIDMRLGGLWVGEVDPTGLPVEMTVDWVRHYHWQ